MDLLTRLLTHDEDLGGRSGRTAPSTLSDHLSQAEVPVSPPLGRVQSERLIWPNPDRFIYFFYWSLTTEKCWFHLPRPTEEDETSPAFGGATPGLSLRKPDYSNTNNPVWRY